MTQHNFDIAIIGNGILSLSLTYSLLQKNSNVKIALIGPLNNSGSATNAAGAMLNCFAEVTSETFNTKHSKAKFGLGYEASKLWSNWIEEINTKNNNSNIKHHTGTFIVLNAKSGYLDTDNYMSIIKTAKEFNEPFEEVDCRDIPGLNPTSDCRPLRAMYFKNEGYLDPSILIQSLTNIILSEPRVTIFNNKVVDINIDSSKVNSVKLETGEELNCKDVVLVAGAFNQSIIDNIPEIKNKIPRILSGMGQSLLIEQNIQQPITHVIRTPNRSGACGLHVLPRGEKNLYIGATNNISFAPKTSPKMGLAQFLMRCVIEQIDQNLYKSDIVKWYTGNRPVSIDTYPLIGKTSVEGLWLLTGTYRDGLHQSPLLAQSLANEILGEEPLFENIFLPERKLIQDLPTQEKSIENVVKHYMAGFYEHGMDLARLFPESAFEQLLHNKFKEIYNKLDTDIVLSPDILFMFELDEKVENNINYFQAYFKNL